jgi:MscS family membrane protein
MTVTMALLEILSKTYYYNTLQDWFIALLIILAAAILGKIVYWLSGHVFKKLVKKTKTKLDDIIVDMIEEPILMAIILGGAWYALHTLTIVEGLRNWIGAVFQVLIVINVAWLITRLLDSIIEEYIVPLTNKTKNDLDDQIVPIARKGIKIIIWVLAIVLALNNAGYNIGALLAGLGIGGLALAMAAKDTVSNIFGGFTILTDHPFKINDRVKIEGFDGWITEIGIRSTRLKTLEGRIVTIPNSKFSESAVENVSLEPSRKVVSNLGLTYDTTHQQMVKAMSILKEIAKKNKSVEEKVLVSFNNFGDFSLGILFIYYIKSGADILETQSEMDLEVLKRFNKEKLEFAFPTQTIYSKK